MIGDGHLGWSPDDGEVLSFSLDEPLVLGRWVLARASTFTRWATPLDRPDWYVHLEAPLEHPELGPFRAAVVRRDFGELRAISIDHDVRANGRTISGGRLPIPLRADGSVDVDACRRLGLVAPVDQAAQA